MTRKLMLMASVGGCIVGLLAGSFADTAAAVRSELQQACRVQVPDGVVSIPQSLTLISTPGQELGFSEFTGSSSSSVTINRVEGGAETFYRGGPFELVDSSTRGRFDVKWFSVRSDEARDVSLVALQTNTTVISVVSTDPEFWKLIADSFQAGE